MPLTVGSLFSGAGLGDYGLHQAGFVHEWFCEIDPFARAVLAKRWPEVPLYNDVREIKRNVKKIDVLAGGFPCQDISYGGKGKGITPETRSGLWFEYARIIRLLKPRWVIVENVKALLSRGMGIVLRDLAKIGYDAQWDVLPAAAFGAPHLRERIIIVAYPSGDGGAVYPAIFEERGNMAQSLQSYGQVYWPGVWTEKQRAQAALSHYAGATVCRVHDGCADWLDRLKCAGNGISPVVMCYIGQRIQEIERQRQAEKMANRQAE